MPRQADRIDISLRRGFSDGPDAADTPREYVYASRGFGYRRGYARTERGRLKKTGSAIVAGKRVRNIYEWTQADETVVFLAVCNGVLYHDSGADFTFSTPVNKLTLGASTATRVTNVITVAGGKLKASVRPGDLFFYDADGIAAGGSVATVDTDTVMTLNGFAGAASAGAFTLIRKLGERSAGDVYADGEVSMAIFDDKLYMVDGYGPLHWLNAALTEFRPAGIIKPSFQPMIALANDAQSGLEYSKNYRWKHAYKDTHGTVGPSAVSLELTTVAAAQRQRCNITYADTPPPWATRRILFRTTGGGSIWYRNNREIHTLSGSFAGGGPTVITLVAAAQDLRINAHKDQYVKFEATGNEYKITSNSANLLTVAEDLVTLGESATDWLKVLPEYDIGDNAITDLSADAELDLDFEAPGVITNTERSYNEPPPLGLKYLTKFRGNGRLCALEKGTQTRIWFSGRPEFAPKTGQPEYFGELEPEYWPHYHDAGPQDGDAVQGIVEMGVLRLFAIKRKSVYGLDQNPYDVSLWGWGPIKQAASTGCIAPKTIVFHEGVAWWLGRSSEELDVIRFDGVNARGFGRPRLRAILDTMHAQAAYLDEAVAVLYNGRLYISYPHTGSENNRTLRFDLKTTAFDVQPYGCGVFCAKQSDSKLYCGDVDSTGHVYEVGGAAQDVGSDIPRVIQTGDLSFPDTEHPVRWTGIQIEVVTE